MGWLDEMKQDMAEARDARDSVSVEAAQIVDTVVEDPFSGEQRFRSDYAGTAWYGGQPQVGRPLAGALTEISTPFRLPDSHLYEAWAAEGAQIQASAAVQSAWIQSSGGGLQVFEASAALGEDPQKTGALIVLVTVVGQANLPLGVAYRVTVICDREAVRRSAG